MAVGKPKAEVQIVAVPITGVCDPELKRLCWQAADAAALPLSEWIARVLAKEIGRPDLAVVPRKKLGRPRKELPPKVSA
jgi:hypothetical protein